VSISAATGAGSVGGMTVVAVGITGAAGVTSGAEPTSGKSGGKLLVVQPKRSKTALRLIRKRSLKRVK